MRSKLKSNVTSTWWSSVSMSAALTSAMTVKRRKVGFSTYTTERMSGFGGESRRKPTLDTIKFPGFADYMARQIGISEELAKVWNAPQAVGKLGYDPTLSEAKTKSAAYKASLKRTGTKFTEDFMTAASPGIVSTTMLLAPNNPAYKNDAEYVMGIANELKKEYEYIVGEGYILQLDAPDLAMERVIMFGDQPLKSFLDRVALHIDAINVAVANIPPEKVRLHVCWGNWNGPHQDDVDMIDLLPILYKQTLARFQFRSAIRATNTRRKCSRSCLCRRTCCLFPASST